MVQLCHPECSTPERVVKHQIWKHHHLSRTSTPTTRTTTRRTRTRTTTRTTTRTRTTTTTMTTTTTKRNPFCLSLPNNHCNRRPFPSSPPAPRFAAKPPGVFSSFSWRPACVLARKSRTIPSVPVPPSYVPHWAWPAKALVICIPPTICPTPSWSFWEASLRIEWV